MDFELLGSFIITLLFPTAGIIGVIICNRVLNKIASAEKFPAIITGFEHGRVSWNKYFIYNVQITEDKIVECRRILKLKFNETASQYLGRREMVPYDREHERILPHEKIVRSYLHLFIFFTVFGFCTFGFSVFMMLFY